MNLRNSTVRPSLDQFDHSPVIVSRMNLCPHLSCNLMFASCLTDHSGFPDVVRERFFTVNMFVKLKCREGGKRVRMFTCTDDDGIELTLLIKQLAKILVLPSLSMSFARAIQIGFVHITQCDDVLGLH